MRRISILCAAAGLGLAATSPARAAYHLIRWDGTGFCQVLDDCTSGMRPRLGMAEFWRRPAMTIAVSGRYGPG